MLNIRNLTSHLEYLVILVMLSVCAFHFYFYLWQIIKVEFNSLVLNEISTCLVVCKILVYQLCCWVKILLAFAGPVMTKFTIALREIGTYKEVLRSQVKFSYFPSFISSPTPPTKWWSPKNWAAGLPVSPNAMLNVNMFDYVLLLNACLPNKSLFKMDYFQKLSPNKFPK